MFKELLAAALFILLTFAFTIGVGVRIDGTTHYVRIVLKEAP